MRRIQKKISDHGRPFLERFASVVRSCLLIPVGAVDIGAPMANLPPLEMGVACMQLYAVPRVYVHAVCSAYDISCVEYSNQQFK